MGIQEGAMIVGGIIILGAVVWVGNKIKGNASQKQ